MYIDICIFFIRVIFNFKKLKKKLTNVSIYTHIHSNKHNFDIFNNIGKKQVFK